MTANNNYYSEMPDYEKKDIRDLKEGDFFTLTESAAKKPTERNVWIRGKQIRFTTNIIAYRFNDINAVKIIRSGKDVYTGFTF